MLNKSQDSLRESNIEEAWNWEISRRIFKINAGRTRLLNREELRKRMRAKLE